MWALDLGGSPSDKFQVEIGSYILYFSEEYFDQRWAKEKEKVALAETKMNNTIQRQRRDKHDKVKEEELETMQIK